MRLSSVFLKPVITEKGLQAAKEMGEYTFLVHPSWDKTRVKEAVESIFGVHVRGVRTGVVRGKTKRALKGRYTKKPTYKKAFVKLAEKEKIDLFEEKKK